MNKNQNLKKLYIERLNKLLELLESNGLKPFLMCGTLLAFIREGEPFSHDYKDIDIALQKEDYWKFRKLIDNSKDFSYYRVWRREIAILYKYCAKIDIFFLNSNNKKLHIYSYKPNSFTGKWDSEWRTIFNGQDFYPLQKVDYPFLGRKVYIPKNPDNILTTHYGDWKIPNSKWTINKMTNVDNNYRQLAFIIPDNIENKEKTIQSIKKLYPENWYNIYNNIKDTKEEPFLICVKNKYIFKKELDINALLQILLSKEEIGGVSVTDKKHKKVYKTFISRTQIEQNYIYDDKIEDFIMMKKEFIANNNFKIAKLCEK